MKLYPPEPDLGLYEEGFGDDDFLHRRPTGEKLSQLVERIEDPLVVVLDGPWGCGKSYFLRRWVGAHTVENAGTAVTVYFDAFAHDFLDDPLTAIGGAIIQRLPPKDEPKAKKALRGAIATLARPAARMALAAATAGISELTGTALDAAIAAAGGDIEKRIDEFWQREDGKRAAMEQVETSLREITGDPGSDDARKLVIVVDELDRCRPDYALAVLEIIKHFFTVPNVHFVLGVNLEALEHSVRARYGERIDAEGYLRRFISLTMALPDTINKGPEVPAKRAYFLHQAKAMELPGDLIEVADGHLTLSGCVGRATIRDMNKILSLMALLPGSDRITLPYLQVIVSLVLMKALAQSLYARAVQGKANIEEIREFYGITNVMVSQEAGVDGGYNHQAYLVDGYWDVLLNGSDVATEEHFARAFVSFGQRTNAHVVRQVNRDFIDAFHLP